MRRSATRVMLHGSPVFYPETMHVPALGSRSFDVDATAQQHSRPKPVLSAFAMLKDEPLPCDDPYFHMTSLCGGNKGLLSAIQELKCVSRKQTSHTVSSAMSGSDTREDSLPQSNE